MKRAVKDQWMADLLSGKYQQTKGTLKNSKGYCCLGVLAVGAGRSELEAAGITVTEEDNQVTLKSDDRLRCYSSGVCTLDLGLQGQEVLGLSEDMQESLTDLNDVKDANFEDIAAYIKRRVPVEG
jgi:hypothetical protein